MSSTLLGSEVADVLGDAQHDDWNTFETELETLAAWMDQPDTRRIILDPRASELGFSWFQEPNNLHPVIGQNLYQWHDGLFRQVGQSWLKHGFCALQSGGCGSCQPAGGGGDTLHIPGFHEAVERQPQYAALQAFRGR